MFFHRSLLDQSAISRYRPFLQHNSSSAPYTCILRFVPKQSTRYKLQPPPEPFCSTSYFYFRNPREMFCFEKFSFSLARSKAVSLKLVLISFFAPTEIRYFITTSSLPSIAALCKAVNPSLLAAFTSMFIVLTSFNRLTSFLATARWYSVLPLG